GGVLTGTASGVSWDLYMYDLPDGPDGDPSTPDADPADGTLTRVSAGPTGSGDCNSPLPALDSGIDTGRAGALRFLSDDGRRAYFTCAAPLAGVAPSEDGTITAPGGTPTTTDATNLYAYDAWEPPAQRWRFVARLPRPSLVAVPNENLPGSCAATAVGKGSFLRAQDQKPQVLANIGIPANCVRGTADGAFITLWSTARLTADDPASGETGDVYAYDAERARLVRITAPQGGPGGPYECAQFDPTVQGSVSLQCFGDGGADYKSELDVNAALGLVTNPANPGDRIAFFQSGSRLVPEDTDDAYDVYQWRNGTLSLLTPGTPTDAFYKGNDRGGRNVYFATRDALTWQDFDSVADVYTARIGGGIPEPPPPPSCDVIAGACQPVGPATPPPPSPNSAGFADAGNVTEKPVRKAKKKKKHKAKKKHGKKGSSNRHKTKRSNATRRAGK
ncbi:MAG TPA: hypothetical protein VGK41_00145, partial [Solirubrobacterales bacterium]